MGSLEEEQLVQMVRDFIESESSPSPMLSSPSNSLPLDQQAKCSALQEILSSETETERQVRVSVLKLMRSKEKVEKSSALKKWLAKRLKMNGFNASLCQTSWVASLGCPGGDYEYIDLIMDNENDGETVRVIVDISFKSQFELARPTPTYKELTDTLPSIFVGSEEKLNKIISLLCSAAKQSLREAGLHVPPWRTSTYMHSKWFSAGCDHKVAAADAGNTGFGREITEAKTKGGPDGFSKWTAHPVVIKPRQKDVGGGGGGGGASALSSQFSKMGINCC